jgi:transposase InsO family protein/transposase
MSWNEINKMNLRFAAIKQFNTGNFTKVEICLVYNISRPTLDKWIMRFKEGGYHNLDDRNSRPHKLAQETEPKVVKKILFLNDKKGWQAKNIESFISINFPKWNLPSRTTIHNILYRAGKTSKYRKIPHHPHPGKPIVEAKAPNDVWAIDYKGHRKGRGGKYLYPLTITDLFSHKLLGCFVHEGTRYVDAKRDMAKVFKKFGLPKVILSDNGTPFSSHGIDGISRLNVWWTELKITHVKTQPASPQQNASHERMHREMQRTFRKGHGKSKQTNQKLLDEFCYDYNYNLKHGGLGEKTPNQVYRVSKRKYVEEVKEPKYPKSFEQRKVSFNGGFKWIDERVLISTALGGKYIGLEEIDTALFKVWFYDRFLGFFDEEIGRLEDEPERYKRNLM